VDACGKPCGHQSLYTIESSVDTGPTTPAHVARSAVRYFPKTLSVDKAKSHSRSEGERIDAWKRTVAAVQESYSGLDTAVVRTGAVFYEIAQQ
jgi:hypothetical protein